MLIIADHRIPKKAFKTLENYGKVIPFKTDGITYESISGHPDIFFCKVNNQLIIAPNLPDFYQKLLSENNIPFIKGELPVGKKYPETAKYNVVTNNDYIFHNFRYTDSVITSVDDEIDLIHINQGYGRCNLVPLNENHFITSDEGVSRVLTNFNLNHILVDPKDIILPGHQHGFFGGTCGVDENKVFILGSLSNFADGDKVKVYLEKLDYEVVELYDGPLFDGGSILFLP